MLFQILELNKSLCIISHVFSSHTIDLCEKKTETEVVIPLHISEMNYKSCIKLVLLLLMKTIQDYL